MKRLFLYLALFLLFCIQSDIQAGLLHRYSFTNGDTTAVDSVGGQHGTLENGASISGNAVQLDGSNDYVNLPSGLITGYTAVSFEAWFTRTADSGTWARVWDFGDTNPSSGAGRDYMFFTPKSGSNTFRYAISDADPGYSHENYVETTPTVTGVPVYVAVVHNSTTGEVELYVNGASAQSGTFSIPLSSVNNIYSFLGKSLYTVDPYLKGSIDEFRIYNSILTPEEIAQHYKDGPDIVEIPPIVIQETDGSTEVIEGNSTPDTYTVALLSQPKASVTLTVDPDEQLDIGNGTGNSVNFVFHTYDWNSPRTIVVMAVDDSVLEADPHIGIISHFISSSDPNFNNKPLPSVRVTIWENECGAWGYNYADLNYDCKVNLKDLAIFASYWLSSLNPITLETLVLDWLKTTQPYALDAQHGPVQDSTEPLFIEPDEIVCEIDEKVYGHFLEHIYHSVNGGLWGELVWNRSFEIGSSGGGTWSIEGDELVQSSLATDVHMEFGDTAWEDYEITLEAKKDGGSEGFLILFRAPDSDNFYWLNLGGWGNIQHAIEKEVSGGRSVVTSYVSGSINTGQWYDIHIRCEGNRFRVWLDSNEIIDYTDNGSPHLSGQVGVGTWATQARYRNIKVTEYPDTEEVLFEGLPSLPGNEFSAQFWTHFGTSDATMDSDALNDDLSVQIVATGGGTGLQQDDFKFTQQVYHGSLWMKGSMPAGLSVELLDGETVLGQAALGAPTSSWDEHSFSIMPTASTDDGSLRITLQGAGTANIDQVSLMGQDANSIGGYRPDLLQAIEGLHPPVIRWPGGCFASLYLWKDGIGPQHTRHKYAAYMWDDQDTNVYGTDEFLRMCEILGIEPIIVINTGRTDSACGGTAQWKLPDLNDYLPYALDWMEYCNGDVSTEWGAVRAANGHPAPYNVKYWEIDNETWWMGIGNYCDVVNEFAPAMRIKAAELGVPVKLIACGSGGLGSQSWNQTLLDECAENIDYISIHHYEDSGGYQSGPPAFEAFIKALGDIIAASSNPDIKIDASEWNLQTTDWRTGLYAGGLLNAFERTGDVFEIGGPALFLRHQSASGWDNAFINFDHTGWFPAPNYVVMKLWHDHYAPYRINMTGSSGNLNAIATKSADGSKIYFKVVNPTDQNVPVKLVISETFDADSVSLQLVAPDSLSARNTLANPNAVHVEERYASLNKQIIRFTMPRISAGVVQVNRKQ
jgi:alpha-N-arabinofuranosidase